MGDFVFNPLKNIILLESFLQLESSNNLKYIHIANYISDCINIFESTNSIDIIQDKISKLIKRDDTPDTELKTKITKIIPKLKDLCDTENMMKCFMDMLYLIKK